MRTFAADQSTSLGGPAWLAQRRAEAFERLGALSPPSGEADVWKYSPIDRFDPDAFHPAGAPAPGVPPHAALSLAEEFGPGPRAIVHNGRTVLLERRGLPDAVTFGSALQSPVTSRGLGDVVGGDDFFVALNDSFLPDAVTLDVPARVTLGQPVVIVHWCDAAASDGPAPAAFLRSLVHVGEDGEAQVIEVIAGPAGAGRSLVVPVGEMVVEDRARLSYVMVQDLGHQSWHLSRLGATVGREGTLKTFTAGLGGAYDRCRLDGAAVGKGSSTEITSVYLGAGDQIHDVRTLQDHVGPNTTSDLLCKGAVAERSRSIYTGLIRVRNGAVRSDAMQTNHNLVLDATAHADSVPNLDIEENDVRCSHASSIGPVDEDQCYYLESRGVRPDRAERLIVLGFFYDIVERAPVPSAAEPLRQRIGRRLSGLLGRGGETGE